MIITEEDLYKYNKNVTILSFWYSLVVAVSGGQGDFGQSEKGKISIDAGLEIIGKAIES